jgi:hypothetical protein
MLFRELDRIVKGPMEKTPESRTFKEFQIAAFAVNADGNRLAIARGSRNQDIVLIKNLRN